MRLLLFYIFLFLAGSFNALSQEKRYSFDIPEVHSNELVIKKKKKYIPVKYFHLLKYQENLAPVRIVDSSSSGSTQIGFVNTAGQVEISPSYDVLFRHFTKGEAIVGNIINDTVLLGVIDDNNKIVVPLQFEQIGDFKGVFVFVSKGHEQWGFYNTEDKKLYNPVYESIRPFKKEYFLVSVKGKKGLIDHYGNEVLPVKYKSIIAKKDGTIDLRTFSKFYIRDTTNKVIATLEADSIYSEDENLYIYAINGRYGLIYDSTITTPAYNYVSKFNNGKAIVSSNSLYGIIDTLGNEEIPVVYDTIHRDSLGLFYLSILENKDRKYVSRLKKLKHKVLDQNLKEIIPFQYKSVENIGDSLFPVLGNNDKWGYIDFDNNIVVPFKYDFARPFNNGIAEVGIQQPYKKIFFYINKSGDTVVSPENHYVYANGMGEKDSTGKIVFNYPFTLLHKFSRLSQDLIQVKYGYKYGVADKKGNLIISHEYDSLYYSPDQNCVIVYKEGNPGIFASNGDTVHRLTDKYEKIYLFKEGYARVYKNERFGCIDYNKNRRIAMQYINLRDYNEEAAAAIINGKWGFIDKNEQILVQPYFDEVKDFEKGIARVKTGNYWDFVNKEGKRTNSSLYQNIEDTPTEKWLVTYNDKKGLADSSGREMLVPRYANVLDLGDNFIQVWREEKTGVLDYNQDFIIPVEFDNLTYDKNNKVFIIEELGKFEVWRTEKNIP